MLLSPDGTTAAVSLGLQNTLCDESLGILNFPLSSLPQLKLSQVSCPWEVIPVVVAKSTILFRLYGCREVQLLCGRWVCVTVMLS